jgi:hypothetical protein
MKSKILFIYLLFFAAVHSATNGKLFLVAGQSNAVGQGTASLSPVCVVGTAFEYNALTNSIQHLQDPMGQTSNNLEPAGTGSIGPSFAKTLNSLINQPIYMVSAARGGASNGVKAELSPYGTWDDTGNLQVFNSAVNKVNNAIQATGLALSGIIWMQGERDANAIRTINETEAEYKTALEKVIARFRTQFGPKLPFYIVLTGLQGFVTNGVTVATATDANYAVRRIQMEVAKNTPNVFVAFTSTNTFFDKGWMKPETTTVHYLQPAYNQIGDSVARLVATIPYDTIAKIEPIPTPNSANLQIIVDNTDAACTFDTPWAISTYTAGFYGTNYAQDGSATANPGKWAKWTPTIPQTGNYRIYMQYAGGAGRPTAAPLQIQHASGISNLTIDLSVNGGKWNYLGMYNFAAGTSGYVKLLADAVGSTIADAVLFEQIIGTTAIKNTISTEIGFDVISNPSISQIQTVFNLQQSSTVSLKVYNTAGQLINILLDDKKVQAGAQSVSVNTSNMQKGIYIVVFKIDGLIVGTKKILL